MEDASVNRGVPPGGQLPDARSEPGVATGEPRPEPSPATARRGTRVTFALLAVFTATYFGTAILTSASFTDLAALRLAGAPLGFLLGLIVIVVGLVVTRIHLKRGDD